MARTQRPPAYRRRVVRGKEVAYLRLTDRETGKLKDVWLGPYGSPESRDLYARATADWESRGRRLPSEVKVICDPSGPTLTQLFHRFFTEACPNMNEGEQGNFDAVISPTSSVNSSRNGQEKARNAWVCG